MSRSSWKLAVLGAAAGGFVFAGAALARERRKPKEEFEHARIVCDTDIQKFCSGVEDGRSTIHCLASNIDKLELNCNDVMNHLEADHPCFEDAVEYCGDVEPGEGRIAACLKENIDDVSPACRDRLQSRKHRKKKAD
jgi:hypothetical protein